MQLHPTLPAVTLNGPVDCQAPPDRLWELISRPSQWPRWSPHVRGAEGLGSPEVEQGARGKLILRGGIKLPAEITEVIPGHSWSWRVGGVDVDHVVTRTGEGSRLEMVVEPASRIWTPGKLAYAPIVGLIARRIARIAEVSQQADDDEASS